MSEREALIVVVASRAHEQWRAQHRLQRGDVPAIKTTKDEAWIALHGVSELDIAAASYEQLPADWQFENRVAAELTVDELLAAQSRGEPLDEAFIERVADALHAAWVDRNRSWAAAELLLPYAELPEVEKEKDRLFVKQGLSVLQAASSQV